MVSKEIQSNRMATHLNLRAQVTSTWSPVLVLYTNQLTWSPLFFLVVTKAHAVSPSLYRFNKLNVKTSLPPPFSFKLIVFCSTPVRQCQRSTWPAAVQPNSSSGSLTSNSKLINGSVASSSSRVSSPVLVTNTCILRPHRTKMNLHWIAWYV